MTEEFDLVLEELALALFRVELLLTESVQHASDVLLVFLQR